MAELSKQTYRLGAGESPKVLARMFRSLANEIDGITD